MTDKLRNGPTDTFEQVAIRLFFQRAVRDHVILRSASFLAICVGLISTGLIGWRFAVAWALALAVAEGAVRLWYAQVFQRARTRRQLRRATTQFVYLAAMLSSLFAAPTLLFFSHSIVGAAIGTAICASVLLVVCAQHSLTKEMFYTSAFVPGLGTVLCLCALAGGREVPALMVMALALVLNARSLHHSNAETFRGLVEGKLESERANAELLVALDAAQQASQAKSTFLATMSHEIRTPLNGVIGMAEVLTRAGLRSDHGEAVNVIRDSGKALLAILNDVLDLSKIEAGRLDVAETEFDLFASVQDVAALFTAAARDKGVSLTVDTGAIDGACLGDAARVRQVLSNVIANAVKFTSAGTVHVTASRDSDAQVTLVVADTGIGIAPEKLGELFERFTQADASITRAFGGTGLGLAVSRELCQLMGGDISAASVVGQGSAFTISLPLRRVHGGSPKASEPAAPVDERPVRALCAEDNATNRLVLKTLLAHLGYEAEMVENGLEAVEAWRRGDWDVVLMDMQMPVMDGVTAMRAIRAEEAKTGRTPTPLVAVTADAMEGQVAQQLAAGANFHLPKPIEINALAAALSAALDFQESLRTAA